MFFLHGKKDAVISFKHSNKLYEEAKKYEKEWDLEIRPEITHNKFDYKYDIGEPIKKFFDW